MASLQFSMRHLGAHLAPHDHLDHHLVTASSCMFTHTHSPATQPRFLHCHLPDSNVRVLPRAPLCVLPTCTYKPCRDNDTLAHLLCPRAVLHHGRASPTPSAHRIMMQSLCNTRSHHHHHGAPELRSTRLLPRLTLPVWTASMRRRAEAERAGRTGEQSSGQGGETARRACELGREQPHRASGNSGTSATHRERKACAAESVGVLRRTE